VPPAIPLSLRGGRRYGIPSTARTSVLAHRSDGHRLRVRLCARHTHNA
jgi:hypothetical protein